MPLSCGPCRSAIVFRDCPPSEFAEVLRADRAILVDDRSEFSETTIWDSGATIWDSGATQWDMVIRSGGSATVNPPIMEAVTHGECD